MSPVVQPASSRPASTLPRSSTEALFAHAAVGVRPGDTVALLMGDRPRPTVVDVPAPEAGPGRSPHDVYAARINCADSHHLLWSNRPGPALHLG